jgi:hypothetical protein
MAAESPGLQTTQRSDHVRASEERPLIAPRSSTGIPEDGRWRPSGEAVGGAIAGGVAGGYALGPFGALVGIFVGAGFAIWTVRYFTIHTNTRTK